MMVLASVTDSKAYVWAEVLDCLFALRSSSLTIHTVFDNADKAYEMWQERLPDLPPQITTSETVQHNTLPAWSAGGYGQDALAHIMSVQEQLRQVFLATDEPYCFWLECDQLPPPGTLERLAARRKDIVMALTPARVVPRAPNCCIAGDTITRVRLATQMTMPLGSLVEVGSVGMGCTLMRRRVMEKVGWEDPKMLSNK